MKKEVPFENPIFNTDYSFQSPRALIRILSDAFSRQHCNYEEAKLYASKMTKGKCIYCGEPLYDLKKYAKSGVVEYSNTIHYDHVYPAIELNLFEVGNVALSCGSCNLDKSSRLPMDYYDIRSAENMSLYLYDREEFEDFLNKFTKPYREKWPKNFEVHKLDLTDDEFKEVMSQLLENIDISSKSSKYNHESSVNSDFWNRVVSRGNESYSKLTAKDIEGRIGYTNEMFEEMFGAAKKIEDCKVNELGKFTTILLNSKYGSKNEIQKFRMLIKMVVEVLNEDIMEGQLEDFYKNVPTYAKMREKLENK